MRAVQDQHFTNLSATPAAFLLGGGLYGIEACRRPSAAEVSILKKIGRDGSLQRMSRARISTALRLASPRPAMPRSICCRPAPIAWSSPPRPRSTLKSNAFLGSDNYGTDKATCRVRCRAPLSCSTSPGNLWQQRAVGEGDPHRKVWHAGSLDRIDARADRRDRGEAHWSRWRAGRAAALTASYTSSTRRHAGPGQVMA